MCVRVFYNIIKVDPMLNDESSVVFTVRPSTKDKN